MYRFINKEKNKSKTEYHIKFIIVTKIRKLHNIKCC